MIIRAEIAEKEAQQEAKKVRVLEKRLQQLLNEQNHEKH
jgi:hypothetical protein